LGKRTFFWRTGKSSVREKVDARTVLEIRSLKPECTTRVELVFYGTMVVFNKKSKLTLIFHKIIIFSSEIIIYTKFYESVLFYIG
jgi:hypothetical protein